MFTFLKCLLTDCHSPSPRQQLGQPPLEALPPLPSHKGGRAAAGPPRPSAPAPPPLRPGGFLDRCTGEGEGGREGGRGKEGGCSFLLPGQRGPGPNWLWKPRHKEFTPRQASRSPHNRDELPRPPNASHKPNRARTSRAAAQPRHRAPAHPPRRRWPRPTAAAAPAPPAPFSFSRRFRRPPATSWSRAGTPAAPGKGISRGRAASPPPGPAPRLPAPPAGTACPFKKSPHIFFSPRGINMYYFIYLLKKNKIISHHHTHPPPYTLFPQRGRSIVSAPPRRNPCPAAGGELRAGSAGRRETYLRIARQPRSGGTTRKKAGKKNPLFPQTDLQHWLGYF